VVRAFLLPLIAACTADRTVSEVPPFQCRDQHEFGVIFLTSEESECLTISSSAYYDCSVSDVQNYGTTTQAEDVLAECELDTPPPCWWINFDNPGCAGFTITIERGGVPAPENNVLFGWCFICEGTS
jgi:hypothetical protein